MMTWGMEGGGGRHGEWSGGGVMLPRHSWDPSSLVG